MATMGNQLSWAHPEKTIDSILLTTKEHTFEICVASNNQDYRPQGVTRYLTCSVNTGCSRGWNLAANLAEGKYYVFISDDVLVGPGAIDALVNFLVMNPEYGLVGPVGCDWLVTATESKHLRFTDGDCTSVSGFLFATPADVFWSVGGFDIEFSPFSVEEIEYSFKIRARLGQKVYGLGGLEWKHDFGVSANPEQKINYLGKYRLSSNDVNPRNQARLRAKWGEFSDGS